MHIIRIELHNFGPFAGHQAVDLQPIAYAVTARSSEDPSRSNWLGKSTFLSAIAFALYGMHSHKKEGDWITHGESEGGVTLFLSDGVVIRRHRGKTGPTICEYTSPDSTQVIRGTPAETVIQTKIGLDEKDFLFSAYLQQRQMARFITCEPSERMKIVSSWLRIDKLVACEQRVKTQINDISLKLNKLEAERNTIQQRLEARDVEEASLLSYKPIESVYKKSLDRQLELSSKLKALETVNLEALESEYRAAQNRAAKLIQLQEIDALTQNLTQLRVNEPSQVDDLKKLEAVISKDCNDIRATLLNLDSKLQEQKQIAKGCFDGVCPLVKIRCPAKDEINQKSSEANERCSDLQRLIDDQRSALQTEQIKLRQTREAIEKELNRISRIKDIEDTIGRYRKTAVDSGKTHRPLDRIRSDIDSNIEERASLRLKIDAITSFRLLIDKSKAALNRIDAETKELQSALSLHREALALFGKNGAQKRVAESALINMEIKANSMLLDANIPLSVRVSWAKPGADLSSDCEACGFSYGTKQRAKECPQCGASRGPNMIQRLEVEVSEQTTGAALDLAGIFFQLAASAWLRASRESSWGVALLDEPFGQLDGFNRQALANKLSGSILNECGFSQSFTVAHHKAIMDALPGQIKITSLDGVSRIEVELWLGVRLNFHIRELWFRCVITAETWLSPGLKTVTYVIAWISNTR